MDSSDDADSFLRAVARAPEVVADELASGARVGAYEVVRRLGSGGMGVVYLARDAALGREVAIKVHRERADLARLEREAIAMARLAHPNVVAVHGAGEHDGHAFVVMEFVAGATLRAWMARPRPWREVVAMMRGAGAGLAAAHAAGLVHRDFKPENVLVGAEGRPRVADFGLVRVASEAEEEEEGKGKGKGKGEGRDEASITRTGAVMGTPAYMAPEQIAGLPAGARADQFALCVTFYEALCGQRPFAGRTVGELASAIAAGRIRAAPRGRAPRWLIAMCARGLAAEPAARWPSVDALFAAIARAMRRRRRIRIGIGATAVAAAAVIAAWIVPGRGAAPTPCARVGAEIDPLWNAAVRARITTAIAMADPTSGAAIAAHAARQLDEVSGAYHDAAGQACRAHEVEEPWSGDLYARSEACLRGVRVAVADATRAIIRTPIDVGRFEFRLGQLPAPARCARPDALRGPTPAHGSPAHAALRGAIHDAANDVADDATSTLARRDLRLARLGAAAEALGDDDARAHVAIVRAQLAMMEGDVPRATALAEQGFTLGQRAGSEEAGLDASVILVRVLGIQQTRFAEANAWKMRVLADLARDPRGGVDAYRTLAGEAANEGRWDEAIDFGRRAVAAIEAGGGTDSGDRAESLAELATDLDAAGRSAEAIPLFRRAIAAYEQIAGPDAPMIYQIWGNFSIALHAVGDDDAAADAAFHAIALAERWREMLDADAVGDGFLDLGATLRDPTMATVAFETARAEYARIPGDHRDTLALILRDLALDHEALGALARARDEIEESLRDYAAIGMTGSVDELNARIIRDGLRADAGDCRGADADLGAAIAAMKAAAPERGDWIFAATAEGMCLRELGRPRDAVAMMEDARAALAKVAAGDDLRAEVAWQLAQALVAADGDRARALALVGEARAIYARSGGRHAVSRAAEIDAWLAKNR